MRNVVATAHRQPGNRRPSGRKTAFHGAYDQMLTAERNLSGALTFDLDLQTGIYCRDHDFVVEAQRKTEAVEAGAKIRC